MKVGSLCSGIDGLALGLERTLGARTAWQAEIDLHASAVLAARWQDIPNLGDLLSVDWATVEAVDVMCFGFPCQDISSAGRRAGLEGDKSGLWFDCADAVRLVRPRYLLVENVGALLVRGMGRVVADLAEMGYVGRWGCLRSSDVGAPHRRERVFVAAALTDGAGARRDDRPVPRPAPLPRRPGTDVPAPIDGGATPAHAEGERWAGPVKPRPELVIDGLQPAQREAPHGRGRPPRPGGRDSAAADADGERLTLWPEHHGPQDDTTEGHHQLTGLDPDGRVRWGVYGPAIRRWEAIHGPAPRPRDDRGRLNPQLPEWMLGFPAGWVTALDIPRTAQLRVLGNAVQPQVADLAARVLLAPLLAALEAA